MFTRLISLTGLCCALLASQATAIQIDSKENYMSIELAPLCTEQGQGQVKVVYTNVSGKKLMINPYYGDPELYDAAKQMVSLKEVDFSGFVQLWARKQQWDKLDYYTVFLPGQSVEHIVNFNEHNPEIDKTRPYVVTSGGGIKAITEDGQELILDLLTVYLEKNLVIGPDCWQ